MSESTIPMPTGAFITAVSGGGQKPFVKIQFETLSAMQEYYSVLTRAMDENSRTASRERSGAKS